MKQKMATVNAPKRKYLENEAKMHFAYLRRIQTPLQRTQQFFFAHLELPKKEYSKS
jgi:hypothetical protein